MIQEVGMTNICTDPFNLDINQDNKVDYNEFITMMKKDLSF